MTPREDCEAVRADNDFAAYDMLYNVRQCTASSGAPGHSNISHMMHVTVSNLLDV